MGPNRAPQTATTETLAPNYFDGHGPSHTRRELAAYIVRHMEHHRCSPWLHSCRLATDPSLNHCSWLEGHRGDAERDRVRPVPGCLSAGHAESPLDAKILVPVLSRSNLGGPELAGIRGGAAAARQPDLWIEDAALEYWQTFGPGGQARYTDAAIQTSLMVRAAFKLPLRQAEGLMASVLTLMDLTISAPDHTTVSRRAVTLPVIQAALGAAWSVARC